MAGDLCLDTGEYLGPPLTHYIDTYVGIAGCNQGLPMCTVDDEAVPTCDTNIGLFIGDCNRRSAFLNDIASKRG